MGHRAQSTGHRAWGLELFEKFRLFSSRHGDKEKWGQGEVILPDLTDHKPLAINQSVMF